MNFRAIAHYLGLVLRVEAAFMLPSLILALSLGEGAAAKSFVIAIAVALLMSLSLYAAKRDHKKIYIKESYFVVGLCWLVISLVGSLPIWLCGEAGSAVNALFETISGFTTTGATVISNTEGLSKSILLWRSFTMWLGGVGVVVFLVAAVQATPGGRSFHIMQAESTGPSPGKIVPKLRQSLLIIYVVYVGLTILEAVLLVVGGMPLFDSINISMSTAGTGGLAVRNTSMAFYGSTYLEMVVAVFMVLFGINFSLYYFVAMRNFKVVAKNGELRTYLCIVAAAVLLIAVNTSGAVYATFSQSLRYSFFQVGSVITTTGLTTANVDLWPTFSKAILLVLMFVGGCGGSSAGGMKVGRVILLFKEARRALYGLVRPRSVSIVKMDGKEVDKRITHQVTTYVVLLSLIFAGTLLVVSLDNFDIETTFTAVAACLNNVGIGFGGVSPTGNFDAFSPLSKLVLSLNMLMGRLELYPILLLLAPSTWRRI